MIASVIGCGQSAKDWIPRGYSVGVNDYFKFGKAANALLVCNRPQQFTPERRDIILKTPHEVFYSHKGDWKEWFPDWVKISEVTWYGSWNKRQVYSSQTSPFIAISLLASLGYTDIILWGVDFVNHHIYNDSNNNRNREVMCYLELISLLKDNGITVYLGARGSVFDDMLPLYDKNI